jgi:transcriptional regulator with XRE-family HTH domain
MKTFAEYARERDESLDDEGRALVQAFDAYYAVGSALAQARHERKITQTQLSTKSGVAQSDISLIERGLMAPTTPTLLKLTSSLHIRVHFELVAEEESIDVPSAEVLLTLAG